MMNVNNVTQHVKKANKLHFLWETFRLNCFGCSVLCKPFSLSFAPFSEPVASSTFHGLYYYVYILAAVRSNQTYTDGLMCKFKHARPYYHLIIFKTAWLRILLLIYIQLYVIIFNYLQFYAIFPFVWICKRRLCC